VGAVSTRIAGVTLRRDKVENEELRGQPIRVV
jgi:hypothetical protein